MRRPVKIAFVFVAILAFSTAPAFSQIDINTIQDAIKSFSEEAALAVPFNSTVGLNWSDAYIGKLIPSIPPHFGIGFSTGFTTLGFGSMGAVLDAVGGNAAAQFPSFLKNMGAPLPSYTVEARIGGFFLPFDIGLKFGILPLDLGNFALDYLLIGADLRYAVIDKAVSPIKVSIGLGYNYLKGGIWLPFSDTEFGFNDTGGTPRVLKLADPKIGFLWGTSCFELKGQLSFKLPFITPYAGAGLSLAFSHAGYEFRTRLFVDGDPISDHPDKDIIIETLNDFGITGVSDNGFKSIWETVSFNMRLFGGFSVNLTVIRIDITAMYNLTGGNYGLTIGGRFQL